MHAYLMQPHCLERDGKRKSDCDTRMKAKKTWTEAKQYQPNQPHTALV